MIFSDSPNQSTIGMSPDDEMDELLALENYLPADELGNQK